MNVKGSFFVSAKAIMTEVFGKQRWNTFMARLVEKDIFFKNVIMSITLIPVEKLIVFLTRCAGNFSTTIKCST